MNTYMFTNERRLKVAIVGGGPGGLSASIALSKLPFVDWHLYEKRPKFSEIGGGFSLQPQTWKMLERMGIASNFTSEDYFRSPDGLVEQRRNGRTGKLLHQKLVPEDVKPHHQTCRISRRKLQAALLRQVDQTRVHLLAKVMNLESLPNHRVQICFEDGSRKEVDLLIGADGIRSIIRNAIFPTYNLNYNGQCVYRTIIKKSMVSSIDNIPWAPTFWKHVSGLYVFTCPLGDNDFEVTARIRRTAEEAKPVGWGRPFDLHKLLHKYDDFCEPVRQILRIAAKGPTQEFALFSGPRLETMVATGNIALVGDASHALLGNFGSGAGFALEDVHTLSRCLEWAYFKGMRLSTALELYNTIRSPHYEHIYKVIDTFTKIKANLLREGLGIDEEIAERVKRISLASESESWMFYYNIDLVVEKMLHQAEIRLPGGSTMSRLDGTKCRSDTVSTRTPKERLGVCYEL